MITHDRKREREKWWYKRPTDVDLGADWTGSSGREGVEQECNVCCLLASELSSIGSNVASKVGLGAAWNKMRSLRVTSPSHIQNTEEA
jgi:hypothetical protein